MNLNKRNTILDDIVQHKLKEVSAAKLNTTITRFEGTEYFKKECYSLREFMLNSAKTGIIAEFKRVSPSKGIINDQVLPEEVASGYESAGASAISVLTESQFFGGSVKDLENARKVATVPILRKDFIIDEYQIIEAKAIGADIILLIANILEPSSIRKFAGLAKSLGLSVLLEVHDRKELERSLCDDLDAVGVNNRNLEDFSVSLQHSYELVERIPDRFLKVSESGISNPSTINDLRKAGFDGFLIGENFMKENAPGQAMQQFVDKLKLLK